MISAMNHIKVLFGWYTYNRNLLGGKQSFLHNSGSFCNPYKLARKYDKVEFGIWDEFRLACTNHFFVNDGKHDAHRNVVYATVA